MAAKRKPTGKATTGKAKGKLAGGFKLPAKPAAKSAPVNEERAAAFVAAVEAPPPAAPAPPPLAGASRLRRAERGERLAIYLPPELAEALRVRCARERRSASDAVTEAVRVWLAP